MRKKEKRHCTTLNDSLSLHSLLVRIITQVIAIPGRMRKNDINYTQGSLQLLLSGRAYSSTLFTHIIRCDLILHQVETDISQEYNVCLLCITVRRTSHLLLKTFLAFSPSLCLVISPVICVSCSSGCSQINFLPCSKSLLFSLSPLVALR